ncbi:ribokinase [Sphingobium chlorophenolicum]|uniref:Ribokinase n=1 Tax=Sphingobium chlorophenolicum TaxID=46429 RepID=A0A081RF06_SPHCR|nr:ribokinase [Sphingobium chlorophenolicum]KEQ53779.1 Phosphofructokinase [Sphingobium chlorophenolicum]
MARAHVVVVGSINCDITVRVAELPLPNQTVLGRGSSVTIGGKGLNQAAAAVSVGADVSFVGAIGDDYFSSQIVDYLSRTRIGTDHVRRLTSCSSGVAIITVDDAGNNVIAVSPGANGEVTPAQVETAFGAADNASVALIQLEIPIETVAATLALARARGVTTILNPAPATREVLDCLPLVDILTPNEHELAELTGTSVEEIEAGGAVLESALVHLQALSGGTVLVTRGSQGCTAFDGQAFLRLPAFQMPTVDTTGAGDVFNGTLAAALATGSSLADAMRQASAAAAISITRRSAENSAPSRVEVLALIASLGGPDLERSEIVAKP